MKTDEQIGAEAADIARQGVLAAAKKKNLTTERVLQRISEENKIFYDKDRLYIIKHSGDYDADLIYIIPAGGHPSMDDVEEVIA